MPPPYPSSEHSLDEGFFSPFSAKHHTDLHWVMRTASEWRSNMTNEQKQWVIELRNAGHGYLAIAKALSLTKNQVSAYCRRKGISITATCAKEMPIGEFCRCCCKELPQIRGRKRLKFCSELCRVTWWNSHQELVNKKAIYKFNCKKCGKEFTAYGNDHRKYCSHKCYISDRFK